MRLIRIALREAFARFEKGGPGFAQAALQLKTAIPTDRLLADVLAAIADRAFVGDDPLPRSETAFAEQVKRARTRLPAVAEGAFRLLAEIATEHVALAQRLAGIAARHPAPRRARFARAATRWSIRGSLQATPWGQLGHLPRYLRALDRRIAKFVENPARDARHAGTMAEWWARYREWLDRKPCRRPATSGRRRLSLAPRGAFGLPVRPGAQDPVSGVVQAGGKGLDRPPAPRVNLIRWQRNPPVLQ